MALSFGANITDIICPDKQNDDGIFELTLHVSGDFNASFEKRDEGSVTILVFKGLKSDKAFAKTLDTEVIKSVNVKSDANTTKISFEGRQLFDISVLPEVNTLRISIIPKTVPLMIEDIAKDTAGGQVVGYILETLLYIALVLFALTVLTALFLKFKLSSHAKKESSSQKASSSDISSLNTQEENVSPPPSLHTKKESEEQNDEKPLDDKTAQKHTKISSKKPKKSQKTLFDI
jgi:hypothetical protein